MLKLYGGPGTRSSIIAWYLEELGAPYEQISISIDKGENLTPEYLAVNPMGKIPAIVDGDFRLNESGAILMYLADKHGKLPASMQVRAEVMQWILCANATILAEFVSEQGREKILPRLLHAVSSILADREYLVGNEFGVADVVIGFLLGFAQRQLQFDFSPYPHLPAYIDRITARPAFQKAVIEAQ